MTTLPERLQDVIVEFRRIAKDHEIKADRPHQDDSTRQWHMGTAEAYDDAADRLEAAQALQAAPEGGELLKGKVTFARLGIVTMHVDQSYFGDHMVGDGDDVLIYNVTRAAASSPTAALQVGEV